MRKIKKAALTIFSALISSGNVNAEEVRCEKIGGSNASEFANFYDSSANSVNGSTPNEEGRAGAVCLILEEAGMIKNREYSSVSGTECGGDPWPLQ